MRSLFIPLIVSLLLLNMAVAHGEEQTRDKLYITNSAGDDVTVVDAQTNTVIGHIVVGPKPHGIAVPAKQDFILVSIEGGTQGELVWIDPQTDRVTKRMDIGPAPNQLAVTPDGRFAYVPVSDGHYEVIDVSQAQIVKRIFTGGRPHNTVGSADGQRMYLAPMGEPKKVTIVQVNGHKVIGEVPFSDVVRPIALTRDEKRLFAEVDGLVGIEMADVPSRKMIHRVPADVSPGKKKSVLVKMISIIMPDSWLSRLSEDRESRSHGLGIRPDDKEIWECDVEHHEVHVYEIADASAKPKHIATIPMGGRPYWLTFSPDGRFAYVSVVSMGEVAVVDTRTKEIVARVPAGLKPKRLIVVAAPGQKGLSALQEGNIRFSHVAGPTAR